MRTYTCKHCGAENEARDQGRLPKYCDSKCKDKWRYYNSDARKAHRKKYRKHLTDSGYWKQRYAEDREYQKARALKYYYDNREAILEQKRDNKIRAEEVTMAIAKIRCGRATVDDAHDWMDRNLGYHSLEVESFIVEMIEDE